MDQMKPVFYNPGWRHNYNSSILGLSQGQAAYVDRADGKATTFTRTGGEWVNEADVSDKLYSLTNPDGSAAGWLLRTADGWIESYDAFGALRSRTFRDGYVETLDYGTGSAPAQGSRLKSVTDRDGRSLTLTYDSFGGLLNRFEYSSGFAVSFVQEAHADIVSYPGGATRRYEYYWPTPHLHNVVDENGATYSTYIYDDTGRAVRSELANGAEAFSFTYSADGAQSSVIDPLGTVRTTSYSNVNGVLKPTGSSQPAGAGCLASSSSSQYDARGNLLQADDFNHKRICVSYAALRNVRTQEVQGMDSSGACGGVLQIGAVLPTNARKISTEWHPDFDLATRVAQPKLITTYVYNGQPDPTNGNAIASCAPAQAVLPDGKPIVVLCKKVDQGTTDQDGHLGFAGAVDTNVVPRVFSYAYDISGRVVSLTDPRGKQTTYTFYQDTNADHWKGDLQSIRNALGHTTTFTRYDRAGRVLETVAPNGIKTTAGYTPRGWVQSITTASSDGSLSESTSYQYDNVGQVKVVTLPDGAALQYTYDDAHRLVGIVDSAGNGVSYIFDAAGNRISEQVRDSSGTLSRSVHRSFDALNRLQTLTGSLQ